MQLIQKLTQTARKCNLAKFHMPTFFSDYDLSTVCYDICVEDAFNCITSCDPTDSECVYVCLRAEVTCTESKSIRL